MNLIDVNVGDKKWKVPLTTLQKLPFFDEYFTQNPNETSVQLDKNPHVFANVLNHVRTGCALKDDDEHDWYFTTRDIQPMELIQLSVEGHPRTLRKELMLKMGGVVQSTIEWAKQMQQDVFLDIDVNHFDAIVRSFETGSTVSIDVEHTMEYLCIPYTTVSDASYECVDGGALNQADSKAQVRHKTNIENGIHVEVIQDVTAVGYMRTVTLNHRTIGHIRGFLVNVVEAPVEVALASYAIKIGNGIVQLMSFTACKLLNHFCDIPHIDDQHTVFVPFLHFVKAFETFDIRDFMFNKINFKIHTHQAHKDVTVNITCCLDMYSPKPAQLIDRLIYTPNEVRVGLDDQGVGEYDVGPLLGVFTKFFIIKCYKVGEAESTFTCHPLCHVVTTLNRHVVRTPWQHLTGLHEWTSTGKTHEFPMGTYYMNAQVNRENDVVKLQFVTCIPNGHIKLVVACTNAFRVERGMGGLMW